MHEGAHPAPRKAEGEVQPVNARARKSFIRRITQRRHQPLERRPRRRVALEAVVGDGAREENWCAAAAAVTIHECSRRPPRRKAPRRAPSRRRRRSPSPKCRAGPDVRPSELRGRGGASLGNFGDVFQHARGRDRPQWTITAASDTSPRGSACASGRGDRRPARPLKPSAQARAGRRRGPADAATYS